MAKQAPIRHGQAAEDILTVYEGRCTRAHVLKSPLAGTRLELQKFVGNEGKGDLTTIKLQRIGTSSGFGVDGEISVMFGLFLFYSTGDEKKMGICCSGKMETSVDMYITDK